MTTVAIDATNVTQITGTVAAANTAYTAGDAGEITGLGNETVVISGETNNTLSVASTLNTLDGNTTGTVNAGSLTTIEGALSDVLTAYGSNGITGLGNEAINLTDASSISSTDLNTLDSKTSGTITTHADLPTLTGTVAELNEAFGSEGSTALGTEAVTITDTTVDAGDLNILNNYTTGVINADSLTKLTGTIADVNVAFAADAASSATISGLGDQAVELTDTNVLAADLNTLNGYTTKDIDASTVAVIEGTVTALNTAYDTAGINGLGNEAVTITDTTAAVADLVTLDGNTSGVIDASAAHTLSGTVSNANSVYASDGFTGLGAER